MSGKRGPAPSNFLEEVSYLQESSVELFAVDEEAVNRAEESIQKIEAQFV